jgi:hypothetical protein
MTLTQRNAEIAGILTAKLAKTMCMVCGNKKWRGVGGRFKIVDEYSALDAVSTAIPVVCCTCECCGNIIMFSAAVLESAGNKE